jgi:hypothetical protein
MKLHRYHFSLEEANNLLYEIKPLVEEMIKLKNRLDRKGYDVYNHKYFAGSGPNGTGAYPAELERLVEIVKQISSRSVLIKDIDKGLLDFPHLRGEEEVYLCWQYDEGDIKYWHSVEEGFAGRRSIDEL